LDFICGTKRKESGDLPLHMAVAKNKKDAVKLLLGLGEAAKKHVCTENSSGKTPSHIAAENDLDE